MVADPKDRENKGSEKDLEQAENAAASASDELREKQLKGVAGGIDFDTYRSRNNDMASRG
jgi:hypothetical protein